MTDWAGMGFTKHSLYTRDGRFAGSVWLPPFDPPCEIVWWEDRFYFWDGRRYVQAVLFYVWPNMVAR